MRLIELIDTLWNVNYPHDYLIGIAPQELIDTLWNVNVQRQNVIKSALFELIDTLWNVNMLIFAIPYVQIQN